MLKSLLTSLVVASTAVIISAPKPIQAEPQHHAQSHARPRVDKHRDVQSRRDLRHRQERRHPSWHRHRVRQHKTARYKVDKSYHRPRHHRNHSGIRGKIYVGGYHRPYHPHGHHLHIHDTYCPVVIHRHHVYAAPTWVVWYQTHHTAFPQANIHLSVAPYHGEVYIDGNFLGLARTFRGGQVQVPVTPGPHTIRLRYGGTNYTRQIHVRPGATALVRAERL